MSPRPDMDEFQRFCAEQKWFHSIDFGDVISSGRFPKGQRQNSTLFAAMEFLSAMNLQGARVLDIGTVDGLIAFGVSKLGAASVVATDSYRRLTFEGAAKKLRIDVDYRPGLQIKDLVATFGEKSFDVIICAGVIYHMLNPFSAFSETRKLVKDRGFTIFESAVRTDSKEPALFLNSELDSGLKELYTYWIPTPSAIVGMAKLCSYNPIATRMLKAPRRYTLLAQAARPDAIPDRSEVLRRIHEADFCDFEFRLKRVLEPGETSRVTIAAVEPARDIDPQTEEVTFPYHPRAELETVGSTVWLSGGGNY